MEGRGLGTGVAVVGVGLGGALCDLEVAFVGHLVEGGFAAAEELAGVAVAGWGWLVGRLGLFVHWLGWR